MGKQETLDMLGGITIVAIILSMACFGIYAVVTLPDDASNAQISRCVETCEQHLMGKNPTVGHQQRDGSVRCDCIQTFTINKEADNVTPAVVTP